MGFPLLEGQVDTRDETIRQLRADNARLCQEIIETRAEAIQTNKAVASGVATLRRQLQPLYSALQGVFGEIDALGVGEDSPATPRGAAVWESWKRKLGGKAAVFIDVLLEHGEMNVAQLRVAAQCGQQTVYDTIAKLHKLGLINKNGGRFSLKQL